MTDRELLEAAAKAAGLPVEWDGDGFVIASKFRGHLTNYDPWNPLTDDGDALRLAVKLKFHTNIFSAYESEETSTPGFIEVWAPGHSDDPLRTEYVEAGDYLSATRRAIVRAAAEIGKVMT